MVSCKGKTALVTNASDGPGTAAAAALANAGAQVLIHDPHSVANVEAIVHPILSTGGVARAIAADISTAEGRQQLARYARGIVGDRLDILVLNVDCAAASESPRDAGERVEVPASLSESASFHLIQRLLPILNRGSSVIFMYPTAAATQSAADGSPQEILGQEMRHLADSFRHRGIRVNGIEISRARPSLRPAARSRREADRAPDGHAGRRLDTSRQVGAAVTFLAANESSEVTGATLRAHMSASSGRGKTVGAAVSRNWQ